MNLNLLAKKITEIEKGKQNLSIAQVKEVIHCLGKVLSKLSIIDQLKVLRQILIRAKK